MRLLCISVAALGFSTVAGAQAIVDRAAAFLGDSEPIPEPALRVVGFQDRAGDGDCDPYYASLGLCIEVVDFLPTDELWVRATSIDPQAPVDPVLNGRLRSLSEAYSIVMDGIALGWFREDETISLSVRAGGYDNLPGAPDVWHMGLTPGRSFALPDRDAWLGSDAWMPPGGVPTSAGQVELFPGIRFQVDDGHLTPAPMAVVSGRFAERLGVDNKPYPHDMMAGTPLSSGPFYEQLFPYDTERESKRHDRMIPLDVFALPGEVDLTRKDGANWDVVRHALGRTLMKEDEWSVFFTKASTEFEVYSRLMGVQVAKNAMMDHTSNHMRILTALTMMRTPPPSEREEKGLQTRGLVAAALGQTDSDADVLARADRSSLAIQGGFRLRYQQLPGEVVDHWLNELEPDYSESNTFLRTWNSEVLSLLDGNLRRGKRTRLERVDDQHILDWLRDNMLPGSDRVVFIADMKIAALKIAVGELDVVSRAEVETWILLDHVNHQIASDFDPTKGFFISPSELVGGSSGHWAAVLNQHGYFTRSLPQGLGSVDPTAICTTKDGRAAQSEPVIGALDVDVLVMGTDGLSEVSDVLWEARDQLPFLLIDDPDKTAITLDRLVGLPSGRAIYRLRYSVWSGWHVFWSRDVLPTGHMRLMAYTGAVCEDMVLVPPDLVPTVVRAGLMDGNFRPTDPAFRREAVAAGAKKVAAQPDADVVVQDLDDAGDLGEAVAEDSLSTVQDITNPEQGVIQKVLTLVQAYSPDEETTVQDEQIRATVTYLRELVREPLRASEEGEGIILAVLESSEPGEHGSMRDLVPRTPYVRVQNRAGFGDEIRGSAWAWYLHPDSPIETLIAPAYAPRESVANGALIPRWKHDNQLDWTLSGGTSFFPFRDTVSSCEGDGADFDIVEDCGSDLSHQYSEGFGFDFSALATLWLMDRPRLAVEWGLEGRVDVVHAGESWFYPSDPPIPYAFTIRPQGGFIGGIRLAPPAHHLSRMSERWHPWGAERPDGSSKLGRTQYGVRGGLLFGPTFSGVEATLIGELWMGRSLRSPNSPHARFTAHHPALVIGPYIRTQYGFVPDMLVSDLGQYLELDHSLTLMFGIRGNLRLKAPGPQPNIAL